MDNGSLFDQHDAPQGAPSKELAPFEFPFTGAEVRALLINGDPWFVAADVCAVLSIGRPQDSVRYLDEDERGRCPVDTPSGEQEMLIINESGLFSLILRSRKPEAKAFKKWITSEVLPSIRRTGGYGASVPAQFDPTDLEHVAQLARIAADQQRQIEARDEKIAELAPKAEHADHFRAADGLKSIGDFANDIKAWAKRTHGVKVKHKQVWDFLAHLKLIIRGNTIRHNHPTAFATDNDYVRLKQTTFERSGREEVSASPRLTMDGAGYAWDRMTRFIAEHGTLELG
jgi:prophage antirepressor-like protein